MTPLPLTPLTLKDRRAHALDLPQRVTLAHLTSRKAIGFRVTHELSDLTPYDVPCDVPRDFATLLDGVTDRTGPTFDGLRFRSRFDTGPERHPNDRLPAAVVGGRL